MDSTLDMLDQTFDVDSSLSSLSSNTGLTSTSSAAAIPPIPKDKPGETPMGTVPMPSLGKTNQNVAGAAAPSSSEGIGLTRMPRLYAGGASGSSAGGNPQGDSNQQPLQRLLSKGKLN